MKLATSENTLYDNQEIEIDRDFLKAIAKKKLDICIDKCVNDYLNRINKA